MGEKSVQHLFAGVKSGVWRKLAGLRGPLAVCALCGRPPPEAAFFFAIGLIAAKPVKPCDGGVFGALNSLLFLKQNGVHPAGASLQKSRRHRPRAAHQVQALPSPSAGKGAPAAMARMSCETPSTRASRKAVRLG